MSAPSTTPRTKRQAKAALGPYGRAGSIVNDLDDRLGIAKGGRVFLDKIFPDHWSFMLGEISLYSFVILLATLKNYDWRLDQAAGPTAETRHTMDWADELAASVSGPQVVNDSKTPSGTVHVADGPGDHFAHRLACRVLVA